MRGRLLVGVVLALALLPPASSWAQATEGDYVRGAVTLASAVNPVTITFEATSDPFGANPAGFVDFRGHNSPFFHRSEVTCLNVAANRATIGVRIVEETSGQFVGWTLNYDVLDGGAGTQDRVAFDNIDETGAPPSCAFDPDPPQQELDPVASGDLVVFDAPGLPKSKDDCKAGGWRRYGVFENQGDCVSFVATGGENTPGKP